MTLSHVRFEGMDLLVFLSDDLGWELAAGLPYEPYQWKALKDLIQERDVCFDVGASIGLYSLLMSDVCRDGKVVAFEPHPLTYRVLELNIQLNERENVETEPLAIADHSGPCRLYLARDTAFSGLADTARRPVDKIVGVAGETLDMYCEATACFPDVVKLDVEGAELLALAGAAAVLNAPEHRPRVLLVEVNLENQIAHGVGAHAVSELMENHGYTEYAITRRGARRATADSEVVDDRLFVDSQWLASEGREWARTHSGG